jgi:MEMO1 family protein
MQLIRQPAVSGIFYPESKSELTHDIRDMLNDAIADIGHVPLKAMIVPHAGYVYSGKTAAMAYACISSMRHIVKRVILIGPAHHVPIRGLALPDVDAFATPLGEVELDFDAIGLLANMKQVVISSAVHAPEHSLEVQLPFLQSVLDDFKLVPLVVGDATPEEVSAVLDRLWGGPETLIVVSSDLSHYLPYNLAESVDMQTVRTILKLESTITHRQACGGTPINGLLLSALKHYLSPKLLDLCNSGDTSGDESHVVGYAAFIFVEKRNNA